MTQKKYVAESILFLLTDPIVQDILNRSTSIDQAVSEVTDWWKFDLEKRRPGPAYYDKDGNFHATTLDLACFMYALVDRKAVINIPTYKSRRVSAQRKDERIMSEANRHGEVMNLKSNKDFFSFSVQIKDLNVIGEDSVGAPRTFMLTDLDGSWYEGWKTIQFVPTLKENRFITENRLWTGDKIYFDNFVSPNRWTSFFGRHYIITKMLIERLREEARHYNKMRNEMAASGLVFPAGEGPQQREYFEKKKGVRKKFAAFEAKIQHPPFEGDFPTLEPTVENMVYAYRRWKRFIFTVVPRLQFMTRASELAHFRAPTRFPAWIRNANWETGYKETSRSRTLWDRLVLFQPDVGQKAVSILKRTYEKSTEVAE